jgi:hypothetical protein
LSHQRQKLRLYGIRRSRRRGDGAKALDRIDPGGLGLRASNSIGSCLDRPTSAPTSIELPAADLTPE